ncbi:MAG: OB-fold nucleic acid binding domain-containing protein, partial [Fusobacteriaceae bacterium]
MSKETVKKLYKEWESFIGKEVEVSGWVKKLRDQKKFGFIELNDGSFFKGVQIVFEDSLKNYDEIARLSISSTIKVFGKIKKSEGAGQTFEILADK